MLIKSDLKKVSLKNSREVAEVFRSILAIENEVDRDKEHFWALGLNTKNQVQYIELTSLGTLTSSLVHPRETFRLAVMRGVASLIVVHNHPSGDTNPSTDDITITKRLVEAGKILGISLLDHLIITEDTHISLMEKGYLN